MEKLHALLAVESSVRGQAASCQKDLENTFEKKRAHFSEIIKTFKPLDEAKPTVEEEKLAVQTTVKKELAWISEKLRGSIDVGYQIDKANTVAKADVNLEDGTTILRDVPTTALLRLGHRLAELKQLVTAIPTMDPTKGFTPDPDHGEGHYKARQVVRDRTEKKYEVLVLAPATEKHPAQVEKITVDKKTGDIVTDEWSTLITPAEKGDMLDRLEDLTRAVERARSRANDTELDVRESKIGAKILEFVISNKRPA